MHVGYDILLSRMRAGVCYCGCMPVERQSTPPAGWRRRDGDGRFRLHCSRRFSVPPISTSPSAMGKMKKKIITVVFSCQNSTLLPPWLKSRSKKKDLTVSPGTVGYIKTGINQVNNQSAWTSRVRTYDRPPSLALLGLTLWHVANSKRFFVTDMNPETTMRMCSPRRTRVETEHVRPAIGGPARTSYTIVTHGHINLRDRSRWEYVDHQYDFFAVDLPDSLSRQITGKLAVVTIRRNKLPMEENNMRINVAV